MGQLKAIIVEHPEYGQYRAENVRNPLEAVQAAAKVWGVQWSMIARKASFRPEAGTPDRRGGGRCG